MHKELIKLPFLIVSFSKANPFVGLFYSFLFSVLFLPVVCQGQKNVRLNNISTEKGLSQNTVLCIMKGPGGFMWFGTQDGLNKYDGYSFTVFKNNPKEKSSISHNYVSNLFLDKQNNIWVGTWGGGLNYYDREKNVFTTYKHNPDSPGSLSHDHVNFITEDQNGVLWVATKNGLNKFNRQQGTFEVYKHQRGNQASISLNDVSAVFVDHTNTVWAATWGGGVNRYNRSTNDFTRFKHSNIDSKSISDNIIRVIIEDKEGILWFGTWNGLNRFDRATESFKTFIPPLTNPKNPRPRYISAIMEKDSLEMWIGTWGGGIFVFNKKLETFEPLSKSNVDNKTLSTISSFFADEENNVWISTMGSGIYYFNNREERFEIYQNVPGYPGLGPGLSNDDINSLHCDEEGYIWIGTQGGINKFDPTSKTFESFKSKDTINEDEKEPILSSNMVTSIYKDFDGSLWVGTSDSGLNLFDPVKGVSKVYKYDFSNPDGISSNSITAISGDQSGNIWIGTLGGGLNKFDKGRSTFKVYKNQKNNPSSISDNYISSLYCDKDGAIWIGTQNGLNRLSPNSSNFEIFVSDEARPGSLLSNEIFAINESSSGVLWVGTKIGLSRFDKETRTFKTFTENDGLPSDEIYSILEDEKKNIWVSTNKGLSKFDPLKTTFLSFDIKDGLQGGIFNFQVSEKDKQGHFYFGGIAGFTVFHPDSIIGNTFVPPIAITKIRGFNKLLLSEGEINKDNTLEISSEDAFFTIEFTALSYVLPEKNRYKYKLEGFDNDWVYSGIKREATYTNLDGGSYTFKVIGSNNNGIWNTNPATLNIVIIPPWWKTTWFRSLLALLGLILVYVGYRIQTENITSKNRILEARVLERTQQIELQKREIELNHNKLNILNLEIIHKNEELERKVDERTKELQSRELQLRLITDSLPVLISHIDQDYRFRFNNKTYQEWFGISSAEITNKYVWEVIGEAAFKKIKSYMQQALQGEQVHYEEEIPYQEESRHVSAFFVPDIEGNKVVGFYALITNISERKSFEEALAKALKESEDKNEELVRINTDLDNFVYTASHDLRSPITNLEGLLQLIIKNLEGKIAPFEQNVLGMMSNSVIRLKRTVHELGEIARIQKEFLPEELLSLKEVIQEVKEDIEPIIVESNAELIEDIEIESINYPHKHLRSILYNLISNGIKYRSPDRTPRIVMKTRAVNGRVQLSVTDNGLGIEEFQLKKIFKMFKRLHTHVEGSGVGLYIVKRIIENNGGSIKVESKIDEGTTFIVNF